MNLYNMEKFCSAHERKAMFRFGKKHKEKEAAASDGVPNASRREKWDLFKAYWFSSDEKWKARGSLALILGLIAVDVACGALTGLSIQAAINGTITAIQTQTMAPVFVSLGLAAAAALGQTVATKVKDYKMFSLAVKWRNWMTQKFQDAWLSNKSHNKLARKKGTDYHPDQRVAQDLADITDQALGFSLTFVRSAATVITFGVLLMSVSPILAGVGLGVATACTIVTNRMGRSLLKKNNEIANSEAILRSSCNNIAANSDHIAVTGLEDVEKKNLLKIERSLFKAKFEQLKQERNVGFLTDFNSRTVDIIPIALAAPFVVFAGASVGSIELARRYYGQLSNGANWWMWAYPLMSKFNASADRVVQFSKALSETKADPADQVLPGACKSAPVIKHTAPKHAKSDS